LEYYVAIEKTHFNYKETDWKKRMGKDNVYTSKKLIGLY
jgi:hypothetical protein